MPHCHPVSLPLSVPLLRLTMTALLSGSIALHPGHRLGAQLSAPTADGRSEAPVLEGAGGDDWAAVAGPNRDFPWWPWILAFPALGGGLWWLLRTSRSPSALEQHTTIPPQMELEGVAQEKAIGESLSDVTARRIILTPRTSQTAYAYWEMPDTEVAALKRRGYHLALKLHDVTDIDQVESQPPHATHRQPCPTVAVGDLHVSVPLANRNYLVELGYEDDGSTWHTLARSAAVAVAGPEGLGEIAPDVPATAATDLSATPALSVVATQDNPSPAAQEPEAATDSPTAGLTYATLIPQTCRSAQAQWQLSPEQRADVTGGQRRLLVRLYDVTELPGFLASSPNSVQEFEAELAPQARLDLPIAIDDRDYLIEVGYFTDGGQWRVLTKSSPVRVPACDDPL